MYTMYSPKWRELGAKMVGPYPLKNSNVTQERVNLWDYNGPMDDFLKINQSSSVHKGKCFHWNFLTHTLNWI